ncbi:MAG TPA: dihydrofolate reductase family protein [Vicinamibacterales bacterium]|nr:dihydrofolate reductase family protein [Vicinamibacterales bacterium]
MRKIITTTFVTLDGVMQAPGGPEEDASGGFKYGGWQAHVMDDSLGEALNEFVKPPFAMLLGRTTYNIFAGFWPKQDPNNPIAKPFNEATTYVVSHEAPPTSQSGSKRVATTQDGSDVEFLTPSGCREGRAQTVPQ